MKKSVDILLAEDNIDDANLFIRIAKPLVNNNLIWLKNGEEVWNYFFTESVSDDQGLRLPKVVFLDLKMPKMNGIELISEIRSRSLTKALPIVVITSSRESSDLIKCYELGINSYIVKPIEYKELVNNISNVANYWLNLNITPMRPPNEDKLW